MIGLATGPNGRTTLTSMARSTSCALYSDVLTADQVRSVYMLN